MKKTDYTKLDSAIVARLQDGPRFLAALDSGDVQKEAKALEASQIPEPRKYPKPAWRFVDTRLQALRKAGVIAFSSKTGWDLV